MKFFDKISNRLVFISTEANEEFWDDMWQKMAHGAVYRKNPPKFNLFLNTTKKYLKRGAKVLEGGCGLAENSWNLHIAGYKAIALDYTPKTVEFLKTKVPELDPTIGDIRQLPFADESIDGYWSFGVIEHFYDGYDEITKEAHRVLKKDGYFFVTFPHMSKLRRLKAALKIYPQMEDDSEKRKNFYQFALDENRVVANLQKSGFKYVDKRYFDGLGGLKNEIWVKSYFLQKIYDSNFIVLKVIRKIYEIMFAWFSSHSIMLVFRKDK